MNMMRKQSNISIGHRFTPDAVPSAGAALPQDLGATVQEYTAVEPDSPTVVCAGTVKLIGSKYCVLTTDTIAGETGLYAYEGRWVMLASAAATFTENAITYINNTTLVVDEASGAGKTAIGIMIEDVTSEVSSGLPSSNSEQYWVVDLNV